MLSLLAYDLAVKNIDLSSGICRVIDLALQMNPVSFVIGVNFE